MKTVKRILWFVLLLTALCAVLVGCSKKGEDPKEECKHENQTAVVVSEPNCSEAGKSKIQCNDCGAVISESDIPATGHTWSPDAEGSTAATCTSAGVNAFKCLSCSGTMTEPTSKISHSFVHDNERYVAATCTEKGNEATKCEYCGTPDTIETPALGHKIIGSWEYNGVEELKDGETCVYICEREATCERCGTVTESDQKTKHDYRFDVVTEATCTTAGQKGYVCVGCHEAKDATTNVSYTVDHSWNDGVVSGDYKLYECSSCEATRKEFTGSSATLKGEDLSSEIKLNDTVISMDESVREQIGTDDATLSADGLGREDIPVGTPGLDQVGDEDTVYNITLTSKGSAITEFDGVVTVKLPYTLGANEDPASVTIFYLHPTEGVVKFDGAVYHDGYVTFETSHFSYYMVGRYSVKEICEKFGHNWFVSEREATCTDSGFVLTYCSRCLEKASDYAPVIAPLGHMASDPVEIKEATCSENGYKKYSCPRCSEEYNEVTKAVGHKWNETKKVDATCVASGYTERICENCNEVRIQNFVQLPHNYKTETVAPTCTEEGYKKYTCRDCGYTYNDSQTPALGHTWDIDAATCGKGQTCRVCGAAGQAATGAHNMVNGICSVCGSGCSHSFKEIDRKDATCTEDGYIKTKCDICFVENTEYTSALGHKYDVETGICSVCNKGGNDFIKTLIDNFFSDKYTITLTNLILIPKTLDSETGDTEVIDSTIKMDFAEFIISVDNNLIKFYGKSDIDVQTNKGMPWQTMTVEIYGDGDSVYIKRQLSESGSEPQFMKIGYDTVFEQGFNVEVDGNKVEADTPEDLLSEMIKSVLGEELVENWQTLIESDSELFYAAANDLFEKLFVDNGNNIYSINFEVLKKFNDDVYENTADKFIDLYYGDGTYADIKEAVLGAENKTLEELVTAIIEYAEENDVSEDMLFTTVEAIFKGVYGQEVDFREMLKDPETSGMTVSQMIQMMIPRNENPETQPPSGENYDHQPPNADELVPIGYTSNTDEFVYADFVGQLFDILEQRNFYELLSLGTYEQDSPYYEAYIKNQAGCMYKFFNAIFSGKIDVTVSTDDNGIIQGASINVEGFDEVIFTNMSIRRPGNSDDDEAVIEYYDAILEMDGNINIDLQNAEIPASAAALKAEYQAQLDKVLAAIKSNCQSSDDGTWYPDIVWYDDEVIVFSVEDGVLGFTIYGCKQQDSDWYLSPDMENIYTEFTAVSELDINISVDCGDVYYVSGEYRYNTDDGYRNANITFYIDVVTNECFDESNHDYEQYIPSDLPADKPTSKDDVACGEVWYEFYRCTNCQKEVEYTEYKYHDNYRYEYELPEGFSNCEKDGVNIKEYCGNCGEFIDKYAIYSHYSSAFDKETEFETTHGVLTVYEQKCPCGYYSHSNYEGCEFSYDYDEDIINQNGVIIGRRVYYICELSGCRITRVEEEYDSIPTDQACIYERRIVETYYSSGALLWESQTLYKETRHTDLIRYCELLPGSVTCTDGVLISENCSACGYSNSYDSAWHSEYDEITSIYTPHGYMKVSQRKCACGRYIGDFDFNVDDSDGCAIEYFGWEYDDVTGVEVCIARCALTHTSLGGEETKCPFYIIRVETNKLIEGETCKFNRVYEYKCYDASGYTGHSFVYNYGVSVNHETDYSSDTEYYDNGEQKAYYAIYDCNREGCDYYEKYTHKYDELGRETYNGYERYFEGSYENKYYERYEYESLESCMCKEYRCHYYNDGTFDEEFLGEREIHDSYWDYYENYIEETCTQEGIVPVICKVCGYTEYEGSSSPRQHWYYYNYENGKYVCEYCGLQSETDSSGLIVMEDLTNHDIYGSFGNYTVGFYDEGYKYGDIAAPAFWFISEADGSQVLANISVWSFKEVVYEDYENTRNSLIVISIDDVAAAAAAAGINIDDYDLAITLSYKNYDPSDDQTFCTLVLTNL